MTAFVETQFPTDISFGAQGGATFSTDIIITFAGHEQRNINWSEARGHWNVAHNVKSEAQWKALIEFFRARKGRAVGFRFKDWSDFEVTAGNIGTGDGSTTNFQLVKEYSSGGVTVNRTITKPVAGTLTIYEDGVEKASGVSLDTTTGIVTLTPAPSSGVVITADFEFDVPVRFDTDQMNITRDNYGTASWSDIPIKELRV